VVILAATVLIAAVAGCGTPTRASSTSPSVGQPTGTGQPSGPLLALPSAKTTGNGAAWPLACTSIATDGSGFVGASAASAVTLDDISTAVGFTVNMSMPDTQSALAFHGYEGCNYDFDSPAGGAYENVYLVVGTDLDGKSAAEELAATKSTKLVLSQRSCTGDCAFDLTPLPGVGDTAFKATRPGGDEVIVALRGRVYLEIGLGNLKEERMVRLAQLIFSKVQ
jgi:hypothetical protein